MYRCRAWYLAGYCLMRQEPRVFRLSGMKRLD
ncbi:MAG: WYL domain-containing protein [Enterocloster bolteae]